MDQQKFDASRLHWGTYSFDNVIDFCKFQTAVSDFMELARNGTLNVESDEDKQLAVTFVDFIDNDETWGLVENIVPEVRVAQSQYG